MMDNLVPLNAEIGGIRIDEAAADFLCAIYHYTEAYQEMPTTRDIADCLFMPIRQAGSLRERLAKAEVIRCHGIKRQRLEVVFHNPLELEGTRGPTCEDTRIDEEEALCIQYLYGFTSSWGCLPTIEDMARDLGMSAQMAHKYGKNLELKGVIRVLKMLFRHNVQLLIHPPATITGRQLITKIEADVLCEIYRLVSPERPIATVKEIMSATGIIESTLSKLLNELDNNGVIKRARIGRKYAIEPSFPITPISRSAVEEGANRSKALSARQEDLLSLIVEKERAQGTVRLKEIFEDSHMTLDVFIDELSRLEMLNKIITHRSVEAYQCFTIPNQHNLIGIWPTSPFKADLLSLGIKINPAQESLLLFYEMHLMKYGSAPPVGKQDRNTTVALAKKGVLNNNGRGVYHLFKSYPGHIEKVEAPYLSVESLEVLRQMKHIVGQRFIGKYPDEEDVFENELLRNRYVCPIELGARLYMTQVDLHKHLKTLRLFRKIKKPAEYYSDWDKQLLYL